MTTKTINKTSIIAIFVTASIMGISTVSPAMASHDGATWTQGAQEFYCKSNLDDIGNLYVQPCTDFGTAADEWNDISSSTWDLTESPSSEIDIGTASWGTSGEVAITVTLGIGNIWTAWMDFNDDYTFGSGASPSGAYDYRTVAAHEIGHLLYLDHDTSHSTSIMHGHDTNVVERSPKSHDIAAIQGMY